MNLRIRKSFCAAVFAAGLGLTSGLSSSAQTLIGRAILPADTFLPGPVSGQFITDPKRTTPFASQPVQGFSAVLDNGDGSFLVMQDNGYGTKGNSADSLLRSYNIRPDFKTAGGGTGNVTLDSYITLSDPNNKVNFPIVADMVNYPNGNNNIPVDASIKSGRLLTGSDFDPESVRRVSDGSLWFGEEFGPFLIHTDASGRLLDTPIALPGVQSDSNPFIPAGTGNLPNSKGFEGMALNTTGTRLYTLLEGPLKTETNKQKLMINEFDLKTKSFTNRKLYYRMEAPFPTNAIGDMTAISDHEYMVVERDNGQGATAKFKKVYIVDFNNVDADGFVSKRLLVDLLDINDPNNISGDGTGKFTFPFVTIEDLVLLDPYTIGVLNDNNYPFSTGRTPNVPDNNEFIKIRFATPVSVPEPGAWAALMTSGVCGVFALRRRARK